MVYINEGCLVPTQKIDEKWEIRPDQLLLESVLGEGAFGLVKKGKLNDTKGNDGTEVAVKMLKGIILMLENRKFVTFLMYFQKLQLWNKSNNFYTK